LNECPTIRQTQICFALTVKLVFGHERLDNLAAMKTDKLSLAPFEMPSSSPAPATLGYIVLSHWPLPEQGANKSAAFGRIRNFLRNFTGTENGPSTE
jgi:hypothetical protein